MTPAYRTWLARDNLVRHEAERLPRCCRPRAWLARIDRRGALVTPPLRVVGAIGLAVALAGAPLDAAAQGSIERGRAMAERLCARCHAISGPGPSPVAQAPAFSTLERKWPVEYLAEAGSVYAPRE
jgi:mono/diheme cytochrome c family protein